MSLYDDSLAALEQGDLPRAERLCLRLLTEQPARAEHHRLLGRIQIKQRQLDAAIQSYRHARTLDATIADAEFLVELASLMHVQGHKEEAVHEFRAATRANPGSYHAWYNLGSVLLELNQHAAALPCLQQAVKLEPSNPRALHNLGQVNFALGRINDAMANYMQSVKLGGGPQPETMLAMACPFAPGITDEVIAQIRRTWARRYLPKVPRDKTFNPLGTTFLGADGRPMIDPRERPLKIGYVSSYFHRVPWMKLVWGLVNRHDRSRYQVVLFDNGPDGPIDTGYHPHESDRVVNIRAMENDAVAAAIEREKIDILVDLNCFSEARRLPVYQAKPAPVIVTWMNAWAPTGVGGIDYIVGDPVCIPWEEERYYPERVLRVKPCFLPFEVLTPTPDVVPPPCADGRPITFGSLGTFYKYSPETLDAWAAILRECPDSPLHLKNQGLGSESNGQFVHEEFERRGVSADRIILEGPADHPAFLVKYNDIDIALDTFPYTGATTLIEAMWQGVPVVVRTGSTWLARNGESILEALGLGEWVARSNDQFVALAVRWARDPDARDELVELRRTLRDRMKASPLCDMDDFTQQMETHYRTIWQDWLEEKSGWKSTGAVK